MLSQLHLQQPLWLLALIPLAFLWWFASRPAVSSSKAWGKVIDKNLLPLLLKDSNTQKNSSKSFVKWLLALGWFIATIALSDPVWQKIPRPVFQTNAARVIVLDLSSSMLIADLKPSRLARARFKIEDILSDDFIKSEEGQVGLVLFAGDAFTASPLTRDGETIRALLQVLTPNIMPSQGSRVDLGLQKALELLKQAGISRGEVLLIADGVSQQPEALNIAKKLKSAGHRLSVLGVGTESGGILPQLKYRDGKSITVKLGAKNLRAIANSGGGVYHLVSTNNSDLKSVLATAITPSNIDPDSQNPRKQANDVKSEDWESTGPFILLLLLPIAALAFRSGWLLNIFIIVGVIGILQPQPVMASPFTDGMGKLWDNVWINKEQQADVALQNKDYGAAASLSKKPMTQGVANYKNNAYKAALDNFKQDNSADARYNEGNTHAKLKQYDEALKSYDKALALQPKMDDALKNKAAIKKLLAQKKQQENSDKQQGEKNENDKNKDNKKGDQENQNKDKKGKGSKESQGSDADKKGDEQKDGENVKDGENGKEKQESSSKNQFKDANKNLKEGDKPNDEKSRDAKDSKEMTKNKVKDSEQNGAENEADKSAEEGTKTKADTLGKEEKMAAEQWLRRIPDDPGGLLRHKFQQQYQRRRTNHNAEQPW